MTDCVLVTGISGFIAKHVALELLRQGYAVRGTVRKPEAEAQVRATLARCGGDVSRLSFVRADLLKDEGWADAAEGCRFVQHVASPFPLKRPADREGLVAPAVGGTRRAVSAALAAGAERIVVTSSIVAMMHRANRPARQVLDESAWSDPRWDGIAPYALSKTRAEMEAWSLVRAVGDERRLAVVNPGFVLGPALDSDIGTSLNLIRDMLRGKYPAVPNISFPIVDVRDLAVLHVKAMALPEAGGRRLLGAGETLSMPEIAKVLRAGLGRQARRAPLFGLPDPAVRFLGLFDRSIASIAPDLGKRPVAESGYVTALTGVAFRPAREAVLDAARSLIALGLVTG